MSGRTTDSEVEKVFAMLLASAFIIFGIVALAYFLRFGIGSAGLSRYSKDVVRSDIVTGPEFTCRKEFNGFYRGGPRRLTLLLSTDGEESCHFHANESKSVNCWQ